MIKHVYIHIPFCHSICSYCDFCKKISKNQDIDKYLNYLEKEIKLYLKNKITIDTLYIGGGTPSLLNEKQLLKLFNIINNYFSFEKDYEFTFECNPEDITDNFCNILKTNNVNRISVGVQTLNDEILKNMNRTHNSKIVINSLNIAKKYFDNISCDFMFDLPNETLDDIKKCLNFIKENNFIKHISYYSLILEQNTVLHLNNYTVDENISTEKYYFILKQLEEMNLEQYEISNFSKPNYESKHNISYWTLKSYYGFGLGASGYLRKLYRYTNSSSLNNYYKYIDNNKFPYRSTEDFDEQISTQERIMLNLRMREGINSKYLKKINHNLEYVGENIRIKKDKQHISNEIIVDLLIEQEDND